MHHFLCNWYRVSLWIFLKLSFPCQFFIVFLAIGFLDQQHCILQESVCQFNTTFDLSLIGQYQVTGFSTDKWIESRKSGDLRYPEILSTNFYARCWKHLVKGKLSRLLKGWVCSFSQGLWDRLLFRFSLVFWSNVGKSLDPHVIALLSYLIVYKSGSKNVQDKIMFPDLSWRIWDTQKVGKHIFKSIFTVYTKLAEMPLLDLTTAKKVTFSGAQPDTRDYYWFWEPNA